MPKSGEISSSQVSYEFRFWFLLVFAVSSLICSLFIIYRFLSNRTLRYAIQNHSISLLIMTNVLLILTDVSWMLDSLRHSGYVSYPSSTFCVIWWLIDDYLYSLQTAVLAWASIERHILIFHSQYLTRQKQQILYHYFPHLFLIVYLFSYHISVLLIVPCQNSYNFDQVECGDNPCYRDILFFSIWDALVHNTIPTIIISIFNIALVYRVVQQKKRLRQPIQWRKHRRMSMPLLSVSAVYLFLNLPLTVLQLIYLTDYQKNSVPFGIELYAFFVAYGITLSLPFSVCHNYFSVEKTQLRQVAPIRTIIPPMIAMSVYRK